MASYNKVIIAGNLTRDPETRVTPKGTAICQFGLAVNRKWKAESGEMQEEVTFIDCEAWGKTAELVGRFLKKGRGAIVEGRLKLDQWDDKKTGEKRSKLKVVADAVVFLGGDSDRPASDPSKSPYDRPAATKQDDDGPGF